MMGEVLADGGWPLLRKSLPTCGEDEEGELQAAVPGERPVSRRRRTGEGRCVRGQ